MVSVQCNDLRHYSVFFKRANRRSIMATRKSKKTRVKLKKGISKDVKSPDWYAPSDDGEHVAFGVLPDRDLKKNLGCG